MRFIGLLLLAVPVMAQDLTTPYAARRLGALVRSLDAPVGGFSVNAPVRVIEGRSSVEASPHGEVLIYRPYLERLSGVQIDPARPATLDAAVAATLDNGTRARSLGSIVAHELGHLGQGHGRFRPDTSYARTASLQSDYLIRRMNGLIFTQDLQDAMRAYRRENPRADAPSVSSHVYEYLADQHAVTATYLKDGNLRGALNFWNKVGPTGGVQYSHPTGHARILNAVSYVEANPQLFAGALEKPLYMRVARDLPPLVLERAGETIRVSGREAVVERLAAPERLVYERYQRARADYYRRSGSTLLYAEGVRGQRLEPHVEAAFAGRPAARAMQSLHADLARGAIFVGPALAVLSGAPLDPALLATDAVAGTLGAAAGAMIPVPVALAGLRVVGGLVRTIPSLAAASVAEQVARQALVLQRQGRLDARTLVQSIDWTKLAAQVLGSGAAMAMVGTGVLPVIAAGIAGGWLAEKLVDWWRSRPAPPETGGLALLGISSYPPGYARSSVNSASP